MEDVESGRLIFIMEWCQDNTLAQRMDDVFGRGNTFIEDTVLSIAARIAMGLFHCHEGIPVPSLGADGQDKPFSRDAPGTSRVILESGGISRVSGGIQHTLKRAARSGGRE